MTELISYLVGPEIHATDRLIQDLGEEQGRDGQSMVVVACFFQVCSFQSLSLSVSQSVSGQLGSLDGRYDEDLPSFHPSIHPPKTT